MSMDLNPETKAVMQRAYVRYNQRILTLGDLYEKAFAEGNTSMADQYEAEVMELDERVETLFEILGLDKIN